MTRLQVKPICAAIMLAWAYGAPALAQTNTDTATTATGPAAAQPAAARDSHCLMAGPFSRTWMRNRFWPASAWSISMA